MWRFLAGGAAALLLVLAGLLMGKSVSGDGALTAAMPQDASALAPAMAFGTLPEPPQATELSREQKRFARYDRDKNARVSRDEYLASRHKAFERMDRNGNGALDFEEYAVKTADKFKLADKDKSLSLDAKEFSTTRVIRKTAPRCACPPRGQPQTVEPAAREPNADEGE